MTPSMHSKQRKIMQNNHTCENILELMIGIALNSRLATLFVLRMTRRRAGHHASSTTHNDTHYNYQHVPTIDWCHMQWLVLH